jgi:hypothetical protein
MSKRVDILLVGLNRWQNLPDKMQANGTEKPSRYNIAIKWTLPTLWTAVSQQIYATVLSFSFWNIVSYRRKADFTIGTKVFFKNNIFEIQRSKYYRISISSTFQLDFFTYAPVLRFRDVYPGSWFLPFPDPGSKNSNKREVKKNYLSYLFM